MSAPTIEEIVHVYGRHMGVPLTEADEAALVSEMRRLPSASLALDYLGDEIRGRGGRVPPLRSPHTAP